MAEAREITVQGECASHRSAQVSQESGPPGRIFRRWGQHEIHAEAGAHVGAARALGEIGQREVGGHQGHTQGEG